MLTGLLTGAVASSAMADPVMIPRIDNQVVATPRDGSAQTLEFSEDPPILMAGGFTEQSELGQPALEAGNTLAPNGGTAFLVRFQPDFRFTQPRKRKRKPRRDKG